MSDVALVETNVARFAAREIPDRQAALEHGDGLAAARALAAGLREMGLYDLGVAGDDDRAALTAALRVLAGGSASIAALLLAHAAGRALAEAAGAPGGDGAWSYPLYADLVEGEPGASGTVVDEAVVVSGTVDMCAGAPLAEQHLVPVRIDGELELLRVAAGAAGLSVGPPIRTLGLRGCPTADLTLERVRVDAAGRLARGARAREAIAAAERRLRGPALAICAAIGERSLRAAVDYARDRVQGGVPICEHQEVRRLLAGMVADHGMAAAAAQQLCADTPPPEPAATALYAAAKERIAHATCDGVQLLGGYGYMEDYPQERHMRDAKQAQVLLGRCEVARQALIADWLLAGARP